MRAMPSGGIIHSNSSSAAGKHGDGLLNDARATGSLNYSAFIQDETRTRGSRSYLVFFGVLAGCFLLSCLIQGWHKQERLSDPPVNTQQANSQSYQYGTAYGGSHFAPQSTRYRYGQPDMRMRIDVNR
ncbi:MAG TPA: hypothetical protein V6D22_01330 [Candidatus Obscuribacterales bacterium]